MSEKMLEIDTRDGRVVRVGDQFGLGRSAAEVTRPSHGRIEPSSIPGGCRPVN